MTVLPNTEPAPAGPAALRFGPSQRFELQPAERRLLVDGQPAALGGRALDLLIALAAQPDHLLTKNELLSLLLGGIFVVEAVSVLGQIFAFKVFGRRIFLMAPIHHHFEKKGWAEPKVIVRFWIISVMLAIASLSTLKLR